jgi:hypothetical protein
MLLRCKMGIEAADVSLPGGAVGLLFDVSDESGLLFLIQ